jgi:acyl carrier protein
LTPPAPALSPLQAARAAPDMSSDAQLQRQVLAILDSVLSLNGAALRFEAHTPLLGAIPEFDSFAAASLLAALEDHFGIVFDDGVMGADAFATVGSLTDLVAEHLGVV